jgi:hypothetical protein
MAIYGRTRYVVYFVVDEKKYQALICSDIPPPTYAPGDYLHAGDLVNQEGKRLMTRGPYRIVRTEHSTDCEMDDGWPKPFLYFLDIHCVRANRAAMFLEGLKTMVRAFTGARSKVQQPMRPEGLRLDR